MKQPPLLPRILGGYLGAFRRIGLFLLLIAASAGLSLLIVFPLWYLATNYRKAYSIGMISVGFLSLLAFLAVRIRKMRKKARGRSVATGKAASPLSPAGTAAARVAKALLTIGALYGTALLFWSRIYLAAAPALLVSLFLIGYLWFGGTGKRA